MPVILDDEAQHIWLDPMITDRARLEALLVPRSANGMELLVTSERYVNYGADDARCVEPVFP
jgi:putative SOS response-associated peptidase YedK